MGLPKRDHKFELRKRNAKHSYIALLIFKVRMALQFAPIPLPGEASNVCQSVKHRKSQKRKTCVKS